MQRDMNSRLASGELRAVPLNMPRDTSSAPGARVQADRSLTRRAWALWPVSRVCAGVRTRAAARRARG